MSKNKKLAVSIGITAHNEEKNIGQLLDSILQQEEKTIIIREIIVISDGSTDRTTDIIGQYKDSRIRMLVGKKQLGKMTRANELFELFSGSILVVLDADTCLKDKRVIERLAKRFREDKTTHLVGGNPIPLRAETLIERAINNFYNTREEVKKTYNFADSGYAAHGRILAYSRALTERLTFPADLLADDGFAYLYCKSKALKFSYEKDAVVLFRSPQTVKDYIAQATRHLAGMPQLYKYFNKELVNKEYAVPAEVKIKTMLYQLLKNPLGYFILKILHLYSLINRQSYLKRVDASWSQIKSSKYLAAAKL